MLRGLAAATIIAAAAAGTAAHADIGSQPAETRVLVTYTNDIDGPIVFVAHQYARNLYGPDVSVTPIHTWSILDTPAEDLTELPTCIVGVGTDGHAHAQAWQGAIELAGGHASATTAVGADRYETAQMIADAIDWCARQ